MDRLDMLRDELRRLGRVLVAFSGGADSSFLAWVAADTLGSDAVIAVTAVSPSLPTTEHQACIELARAWDLRWIEVETDEMSRAAYRLNDGDRCFHCKDALMDAIDPLVDVETTVVLGVNVDDLGDHRPGQRAAAERGARFPLVDAGYTKAEVRVESRRLGLVTWDKPAAACLASRVPYGTEVTLGVLRSVERAEAALGRLGYSGLRVRHHGDIARIEVPVTDLDSVVADRELVIAAVHAAGFRYCTLDLEGFRSGNLNDVLDGR